MPSPEATSKLKVPLSELIRAAEPKVIAPTYVLSPLMLRKAPPELMPVPFNVNASALKVRPPDNSRAAPFATVVPLSIAPNAAALVARKTPALIVVTPV